MEIRKFFLNDTLSSFIPEKIYYFYFPTDWDSWVMETSPLTLTNEEIIKLFSNAKIEAYSIEEFADAFNNEMVSDLGHIIPFKVVKC